MVTLCSENLSYTPPVLMVMPDQDKTINHEVQVTLSTLKNNTRFS